MSLLTPETHPDHEVVGRLFEGGWPWGFWYCDSYDPRIGYWMTKVGNPDVRRNVSERAIGATFHRLFEWRVSMIPQKAA